jgi:hypothetical protein
MTQALVSRFLAGLPAPGRPLSTAQMPRMFGYELRNGMALASAAVAGAQDIVDLFDGSIAALQGYTAQQIAARLATDTIPFNRLQFAERGSLSLTSDPVGFKPLYIARHPDGSTWLATRLADLLRLHPGWAQPLDRVALHSLFMGRACWGSRTLHAQIRRVDPGTVLHWTPVQGVTATRARRWRFPPTDEGLTYETAKQRFQAPFTEAIAAATGGGSVDALALSGGYDSRLIAAEALRQGLQFNSYTFGSGWLREVRQVKAVTRALGLPHQFVPLDRDLTLTHRAHATSLFEGCIDIALLHTYPLVQLGLPVGSRWLHGFGGDLMPGVHAARIGAAGIASHDHVAEATVTAHAYQDVDAATLFGAPFDRAALVELVSADLDRSQSPLAAYHLWDWESHVRRNTCGVVQLLAQRYHLCMPHLYKPYADIWAPVPLEGLLQRSWYKRWFLETYPVAGNIAHPDMLPPALWRRAANRLIGYRSVDAQMRRIGRSDIIFDNPNLVSRRHARMADALIAEGASMLDRHLGLQLAPGYQGAFTDPRFRPGHARRIVLTLLSYAEYLDRETQTAVV